MVLVQVDATPSSPLWHPPAFGAVEEAAWKVAVPAFQGCCIQLAEALQPAIVPMT
jgi:hypothetical protein